MKESRGGVEYSGFQCMDWERFSVAAGPDCTVDLEWGWTNWTGTGPNGYWAAALAHAGDRMRLAAAVE